MASLLVVTGCGVDPPVRSTGPNAILGGGIENALDAMALLDPAVYDKIGDCFESAKFKTFNGDPHWTRVWDEGGRTPAALRGECEDIAVNDPGALDAIHIEWVAWETSTGSQAAEK